jgi:sugar phosphate isomerase/epimerase
VKLSVSNIAWASDRLEEHLDLLNKLGCDGVEIAPSKVWDEPSCASEKEINDLGALVSSYSLEIPALHALLFTRPDLHLFESEKKQQKTVQYLKQLINIAGVLKAGILVYGSPASRSVGSHSYNECYEIAVRSFRELALESQLHKTCFCIEPLSLTESDFITSSEEGYQLVSDVGHPYFGLHLDARAMHNSCEVYSDIFNKYGNVLKHFHVGGPDLLPPGYGEIDHKKIGVALKASGYDGFVSIEMRQQGLSNSLHVVKEAVDFVRDCYF